MVAPGPRRAVQTPALANHKEEMERQDALEDEKRREYEEEGEIFRKRLPRRVTRGAVVGLGLEDCFTCSYILIIYCAGGEEAYPGASLDLGPGGGHRGPACITALTDRRASESRRHGLPRRRLAC
jgi:hypothetical protein